MRAGVVLLAVNDFPPLLGGESALYYGLARHLPPRDTLILAPRAPGGNMVDRSLQVEVIRRWLPPHGGALSRFARALLAAGHLLRLLRRRPIRYLLCGQLLSLGVPTRLAARLFRIPYAVFVHGADLLDYHDRDPWGRLAAWVVAGAQAVVVNSRFTASMVDRLLPGAARRIVVLPIGVDPAPRVDPVEVDRLRRRYGLGGGPILLSVSRLVEMKGHDVVIEALPRLLARHPAARYLIVGDGPHRPALERLTRHQGVENVVICAGKVPAAEIPAHYALATLFVQLSRRTGAYDGLEGFGISFLEAASHGLPCIGGRSGGVPEAVEEGESGILVPPEDGDAFLETVERLLSAPRERARMAESARRWAAAHTWERSVACLRSLAWEA